MPIKPPRLFRRSGHYGQKFYDDVNGSSGRSAEVIVPLVVDLLGVPESVVDVGCGAGAWLRAFAHHGVDDYVGFDGGHVRSDQLLVPSERFHLADLRRPLRLERRFALAVCLEVAEHLPEEAADQLVGTLVELSDQILFSAAIPYQGGIGHVNEQWPGYWQEKFSRHDYVGLDPFRMRIWTDDRVSSWFAQNLVLYVGQSTVDRSPKLIEERKRSAEHLPALVHPGTYASKARLVSRIMDVVPRPLLEPARRRLRIRPDVGGLPAGEGQGRPAASAPPASTISS